MKLRHSCFPLAILFILGCAGETTFDKQVKACTEDTKLGLGDPNSIELVSTEKVDLSGGGFRVVLNFTAKNAMGGRVRGQSICGFKTKDTSVLDPDDLMNQQNSIRRTMKNLGIN